MIYYQLKYTNQTKKEGKKEPIIKSTQNCYTYRKLALVKFDTCVGRINFETRRLSYIYFD
jgi:hypothetical protein